MEESVKDLSSQIYSRKVRSGLLVGGLMLVVFVLLTRAFTGVVCAKLPFEPFIYFQQMTHYGIKGTDT